MEDPDTWLERVYAGRGGRATLDCLYNDWALATTGPVAAVSHLPFLRARGASSAPGIRLPKIRLIALTDVKVV